MRNGCKKSTHIENGNTNIYKMIVKKGINKHSYIQFYIIPNWV